MTNPIKRYIYRKLMKIVFDICLEMRIEETHDNKTLSVVLDRLERKLFPESFANVNSNHQ